MEAQNKSLYLRYTMEEDGKTFLAVLLSKPFGEQQKSSTCTNRALTQTSSVHTHWERAAPWRWSYRNTLTQQYKKWGDGHQIHGYNIYTIKSRIFPREWQRRWVKTSHSSTLASLNLQAMILPCRTASTDMGVTMNYHQWQANHSNHYRLFLFSEPVLMQPSLWA